MKIIERDGTVKECEPEQELHVLRHTAAHVMAQAIKRLYPEADFAFGPATERGFYYDVDLGDTKLTDEDLLKIEDEMRRIVKENLPIKPFILSREEAAELLKERNEKYKLEHIDDLPEDAVISFYQQGEYIDMCVPMIFSSGIFIWLFVAFILVYLLLQRGSTVSRKTECWPSARAGTSNTIPPLLYKGFKSF